MKKTVIILIASFCLAAGCDQIIQPIKEEEVLDRDPAFKSILEKKNKTDAQINELKNQDQAEQQSVDTQIRLIYTQRQASKKHLLEAIRQAKSQLNGERNSLRLKIKNIDRALQTNEQQLRNVNAIIFNTRQLLEKKNTPPEKARREIELKSNLDAAAKIEAEINKLKEKGRLYRSELQLLQQ